MLDRDMLQKLVIKHGPCVRVVTADVRGSGPREIGAAMVVWEGGQHGTIGGGTLEFEATKSALNLLKSGKSSQVTRHPLGPELGQCCGGAVTLVSERLDQQFVDNFAQGLACSRRVEGSEDQPLSIARNLANARSKGQTVATRLEEGWWVEPVYQAPRKLWVWGAGHVGRAIVDVMGPLPEFSITWIDTDRNRFPDAISENIDWVTATKPEALAEHVPQDAEHLILTFSHSLDLALCHALLQRGFANAGLIGSKTKWARFQKRLSDLGHSRDQILRIDCPIGDPSLGKNPQAIAISVAAKLLNSKAEQLATGTNKGTQTA